MLEENLLISKGTSVGAGTVITNSVIGRDCVIGEEKCSYVWFATQLVVSNLITQ